MLDYLIMRIKMGAMRYETVIEKFPQYEDSLSHELFN